MDHNKPTKCIYKSSEFAPSSETVQLLDDLRIATIRGCLEDVKKCLNKGIAVNQTLKGGWSSLMYACSMGHSQIVQYLLQEGANPNFHKELFTSLMAACASTQENEDKLVRCVELLINSSADVNAVERHRISALMFAAKEGRHKLVSLLADPKNNCDLNLQDSQGWTALFWAVNQGKTKVISVLAQQGAKVNLKDRKGHTALDLANSKGLQDIAAILNNKSIPNGVTENNSNLYGQKKNKEMLFEALLDELMNAENNNSRQGKFGPGCLTIFEPDKNLEMFKGGTDMDKQYFQNNLLHAYSQLQPLLRNGVTKKSMETLSRNVTYSIIEAEQVLSHAVKHLTTVLASISYVRLQVQSHTVNNLLEDKNAKILGLNTLTQKALYHTQLLQDELKFLHHYGQKLEESDKMVPADLLIEKKYNFNNGKLATIAIVSAAIVVAFFKKKLIISLIL